MTAGKRPLADDGRATGFGPPVVFLSYCREDAEWLRRFEVMLKPEVRNRGIDVWSDALIRAGRRWRPEVDDAIARANIALLLVSPDFLCSDFIMNVELPALIARGVPLVPVLVRGCRWDVVPELARPGLPTIAITFGHRSMASRCCAPRCATGAA